MKNMITDAAACEPDCGHTVSNTASDTGSGYLLENYRLFHISDTRRSVHEFHYHDFDKIVIPLSGNVTYMMEGRTYLLRRDDILFVPRHYVHKSIIRDEAPYERIVLWIDSDFLLKYKSPDADLGRIFSPACERREHLLRLPPEQLPGFSGLLRRLEDALKSNEFASALLCDTLFLQLIIFLNRAVLAGGTAACSCLDDIRYDSRIEEILRYIETHLSEDLSAGSLASRFYLSKSYLMHRFREQTGCTLHSYIRQKRLLYARHLLKEQIPVTEACQMCGFQDYSAFLRAFKELFQCLPSDIAGS